MHFIIKKYLLLAQRVAVKRLMRCAGMNLCTGPYSRGVKKASHWDSQSLKKCAVLFIMLSTLCNTSFCILTVHHWYTPQLQGD